ncbi:hypothetical protein BAU15_06710 [Enterococcus sp. JM4C]|uniref:glycosyltransferase family 2 protein n=1 Tax=Candidatus Enterococcus huntleyi TaxID=1857217 RepID=UPI00137B0442|nr:glycosyltransferase family 2 protein [Enterococcus sp. JM4C]KAF1297233.1 hypothetical protein BAU15_06710 [Enterococcus sp. JM4C]
MLISVIIPVYNAEKTLRKTLESIFRQSGKFEVVLVNDGSSDGSERLCMEYLNKYPEIIRYKKTRNAGASSARNAGFSMVSSESSIITFIDSDDEISDNCFQEVIAFFGKHREISMAVTKLIYKTGSLKREHNLNYRFTDKQEVIDILNQPEMIHFHMGGAFFRKQQLDKQNLSFKKNLQSWEDAYFINELLLDIRYYGVVSKAAYYYNVIEGSLTNRSWQESYRYGLLIEYGYLALCELSKKMYGKVIPYIQYLVINHYSLFLTKNALCGLDKLSEEERIYFYDKSNELFSEVDDSAITTQRLPELRVNYMTAIKKYKVPFKTNSGLENSKGNKVIIKAITISGLQIRLQFELSNDTGYLYEDTDIQAASKLNGKLKIIETVVVRNFFIQDDRRIKFAQYSLTTPVIFPFFKIKISEKNHSHTENIHLLKRIVKHLR